MVARIFFSLRNGPVCEESMYNNCYNMQTTLFAKSTRLRRKFFSRIPLRSHGKVNVWQKKKNYKNRFTHFSLQNISAPKTTLWRWRLVESMARHFFFHQNGNLDSVESERFLEIREILDLLIFYSRIFELRKWPPLWCSLVDRRVGSPPNPVLETFRLNWV